MTVFLPFHPSFCLAACEIMVGHTHKERSRPARARGSAKELSHPVKNRKRGACKLSSQFKQRPLSPFRPPVTFGVPSLPYIYLYREGKEGPGPRQTNTPCAHKKGERH